MTEVVIKMNRVGVEIGGRTGEARCYVSLKGHSDVSGEGLPSIGTDNLNTVIEYIRLAAEMERSGEA